jgi:hypothetical protein
MPLTAAAAALAVLVAGCGSSSKPSPSPAAKPATPSKQPEVSPSGDIPDNQAYVPYAVPGAGFTVSVPEGWSQSGAGKAVIFSDKLNSIRLETATASTASSGVAGGKVSTVQRHAGKATRIAYLTKGAPNPVTGKAVTDAVERYIFTRAGRAAVLTLSGPKTADNVDPWRIITNSVRWTR